MAKRDHLRTGRLTDWTSVMAPLDEPTLSSLTVRRKTEPYPFIQGGSRRAGEHYPHD
jgi:hypothetical protein